MAAHPPPRASHPTARSNSPDPEPASGELRVALARTGGVAVTLAAGQASALRLRSSGSCTDRPTPTLRSWAAGIPSHNYGARRH